MKDWNIFSKRVPEWRERYLEKINREITDILNNYQSTPTERFWGALKKMNEEKYILTKCFDGHKKSGIKMTLFMMHRYGVISDSDLDEFSTLLQENMQLILETTFDKNLD